jgi:hypothetical protein
LSGGQHQTVGEASGEIRLASTVSLHLGGNSVPAGVYRLLATVKLGPSDAPASSRQHLMAQREGGVLQIY